MAKHKMNNQPKSCPSCGAPVVSEICAYCGTPTGLNTSEADMEFPVLECKEVIMSFWTIWFPMIFAGAFGLPGIIMLIIYALAFRNSIILLLAIPFILIGITASFFVIRTILRYIKVKTKGKKIQGTVYGYIDDNITINSQPAQIIKLLVQTSDGPRFLLYQLGNTLKPYGIHTKIDILVYQNLFMIYRKKETINW